jgi:large subunit ribosomal protein L23
LKRGCWHEEYIQCTCGATTYRKGRPEANKIEIKTAVEQMFNVKVKNVKTANMHGKQKRVGKTIGFTKDWKKAYVTLSEGKINFADEL